MKTICIQIGNSDNKLTQQTWSDFVKEVENLLSFLVKTNHTYFFGGSANWMPWQNVCWIIKCDIRDIDRLKENIKNIREKYSQDSVALLIGESEFI